MFILTSASSQTPHSILCAAGARPNFMKMAPILVALNDLKPSLAVSQIHTGQHDAVNMNHQNCKALGSLQTDFNLEVGSGSHSAQIRG